MTIIKRRPHATPFCRNCESYNEFGEDECSCGSLIRGWTWGEELKRRTADVDPEVAEAIRADLLAALEEWRPIMGMVTNETGDVDVGAALKRADAAIAKAKEGGR